MRRTVTHAAPARRVPRLAILFALALTASTASAQVDLIRVEFNEDDQTGFDLWPVPLSGSFMSAQFGAITVDVSTNTGFASPTNRGSMNGSPPGYTYQHLYEDLLHAFTPTGTLTFDFSGLQPSTRYTFTLYAWDPGQTAGTHEWSVTGGVGVPSVQTVDWSQPLVDNETFALVFEITTTAAGTFQVDNTNGLPQSAVNGFRLSTTGVGTNYCGPAVPNSTGRPGRMGASGSPVVAANGLIIEAEDLPTASFAFFLTSRTQGLVVQPGGSSGNLCLGGAIGRFVGPGQIQNTGGVGAVSIALDLTSHPTPTGFVAVAPGETWNFQCWFRDTAPSGGVTSNFTDGLEVVFQ